VIAPETATAEQLAALYRLVAELFLYPEDRSADRTEAGRAALEQAPARLRQPIEAFLKESRAVDPDEYLAVLELSPPCPLYLGSYIFDEPKSCLGAGLSGRNGYMIELAGTYRHFGFELGSRELADFLPAMTEFLAISLEHHERDGIGLRRRFVESYYRPGLAPMREALAKYESPYGLLIAALEAAIEDDVALAADPSGLLRHAWPAAETRFAYTPSGRCTRRRTNMNTCFGRSFLCVPDAVLRRPFLRMIYRPFGITTERPACSTEVCSAPRRCFSIGASSCSSSAFVRPGGVLGSACGSTSSTGSASSAV
jgi:nitrate reductase delta subunit